MTPHPDPAVLDALVLKLEAAGEGSRELDADIWLATGCSGAYSFSRWRSLRAKGDPDATIENYAHQNTPHFTRSLNAALTLVPEGSYLDSIERDQDGAWRVAVFRERRRGQKQTASRGYHHAMTLAVCIASLRARQAAITDSNA